MKRPKSYKQATILKRDNGICVYCGGAAQCVDHILPWIFSRDNREDNLAASCTVCNAIAGDKVFENFIEKKNYILDHRLKKGKHTTQASGAYEKKTCNLESCGELFEQKRFWQKYCCQEHQKEDWQNKHPKVTPKLIERIDNQDREISAISIRLKKLEGKE